MLKSQEDNKIYSVNQLHDWFTEGAKEKEDWKVGTEHEKFAYLFSKNSKQYVPLKYLGKPGIESFLIEISKHGWTTILDKNKVIGLKKGKQSITLEPGGQVELSGAPLFDLHSTCRETNEHLKLLKKIGEKLNITLLGLGSRPFEKLDDLDWMPKSRYTIMKNYMPKKGKTGIEMMLSTCTVQANLDYSSEQDMINKITLATKIQPIITALFANSPFSEGQLNGYLSKRRYIWTDTDKDRCGVLKPVFEKDFSFMKYINYALSVPMYFIIRKNKYINCAGKSFKDFMNGSLDILEGERPTFKDWEDHLSTIFNEVRLKKFIEVRGADAGTWRRTCALPAFWVGLLYDTHSLNSALNLSKKWSYADVEKLSTEVSKKGLKAKIQGFTIFDIAKELLSLANNGLKERSILDKSGKDETVYLSVLEEILSSKKTPAEKLIDNFNEKWSRRMDKLISDLAY